MKIVTFQIYPFQGLERRMLFFAEAVSNDGEYRPAEKQRKPAQPEEPVLQREVDQMEMEKELETPDGRRVIAMRIRSDIDNIMALLGFSVGVTGTQDREIFGDYRRMPNGKDSKLLGIYEVRAFSFVDPDPAIGFSTEVVIRKGTFKNDFFKPSVAVTLRRKIDMQSEKPGGKKELLYEVVLTDYKRGAKDKKINLDFRNGKYDFDVYEFNTPQNLSPELRVEVDRFQEAKNAQNVISILGIGQLTGILTRRKLDILDRERKRVEEAKKKGEKEIKF